MKKARYISRRASKDGENACIDASEEVEACLRRMGHEVERVELDESYKPLDILRERIKREVLFGEEVSEDAIEWLVEDHLRFTDLIVKKEFEEAYQIWTGEYYVKGR